MRTRFDKLLLVCLSLLAASVAQASPTLTPQQITVINSAHTTEAFNGFVETIGQIDISAGPGFAQLAKTWFQPPSGGDTNSAAGKHRVSVLPAGPSAAAAVLIGFCCVSFIHDKKIWLAVFASIAMLGQFGVKTIPRIPRMAQRFCRLAAITPAFEALHTEPFAEPHLRSTLSAGLAPMRGTEVAHAAAPAIIASPYLLKHAFDRLAFGVRRIFCFLPELTFNTIPRGPPCRQ